MKKAIGFVGATILGGFFVILPIALIVLLMGEITGLLADTIDSIAESVPVDELSGIEVRLLVTVLTVVALCFLVGLLVNTRLGAGARDWLERTFLDRIPGYALIRNLTRRFSPDHKESVALVRLGGGQAQALAFVVEALPDGRFTVFVPIAPTPTIGTIYVVDGDDVDFVPATMSSATNSIMQWGIGTGSMLAGGAVPAPAEAPVGDSNAAR